MNPPQRGREGGREGGGGGGKEGGDRFFFLLENERKKRKRRKEKRRDGRRNAKLGNVSTSRSLLSLFPFSFFFPFGFEIYGGNVFVRTGVWREGGGGEDEEEGVVLFWTDPKDAKQ